MVPELIQELSTELNVLQIVKQDDYLESEKFSLAVQNIEDNLNRCYQFSRLLETANENLSKTLHELFENKKEMYVQVAAQLEKIKGRRCTFSFDNSVFDRDKTRLSPAVPLNSRLIFCTNEMIDLLPAGTVTVDSSETVYSLPVFMQQGHSILRSEKEPVENDITETYTLSFSVPQELGYLYIDTGRCELRKLEYIYEDGTIELENDLLNHHVQKKNVQKVVFTVGNNNYEKKMVTPQKDWINNFMSRLENLEKEEIRGNVIFEGAAEQEARYTYPLEVNRVVIKKGTPVKACGALSQEFNVLRNTCFELLAGYDKQDGDIEFYIIENGREFPILPLHIEAIQNERLFPEKEARFPVDYSKLYNIDRQLNFHAGMHTASYIPASGHFYQTVTPNIKLKVIMRRYGKKPPILYHAFLQERTDL